MKTARKFLRAGVTLVELALALVIIGLLMGVFFSRAQPIAQEQYWIDAETQLSAIQEAVVLYAAKNKTTQRRVEVFRSDLTLLVSADTLPAGRPILPCPDVNGDGIEDRQREGAMPPAGATLTIMAPSPTVSSAGRISADDNPLLQFGNCVLQKGALPWRSLPGVFRATDPWGNLYTYRVDSNYSNRLIGFDENTRADSYDARMPWVVSGGDAVAPWPVKRALDPGEMNVREWRRFFTGEIDRGGIIPAMLTVNERASVVCQRPPCPPRMGEANALVAGMLASTAVTLTTTQRFSEGAPPARILRAFSPPASPQGELEVVEGMPFVIVSHGREDRGAWLNHRKTENRGAHMALPLNLERASDVNNALNFGIGQAPESQYLSVAPRLRGGQLVLEDLTLPSAVGNWGARFRGAAGSGGFEDNGFVQPRGVRVVDHNQVVAGASQPVHDDVVMWMTMRDLNQAAFRAGIYPVRPLPPFGIERN